MPEKIIHQTFKNTTQLGRVGAVKGLKLWKRHKAPNPALNTPRRNEPVATDTINGAVPAVDNGSTAAQIFIGRISGLCEAEGIGTSDKQYAEALANHIRRYGAMDQIISDVAKAQISKRVNELLNTLMIDQQISEPHNKNQNYAERVWRDLKRMVERVLDFSDAPAYTWLLALQYVCFIKNHVAQEKLGWRTAIEWVLGFTPDISVLLIFTFWEPVYYAVDEAHWPRDTREAMGRFVGISNGVGNAITFKILTENMKVIRRSVVRSGAGQGIFVNLRANKEAPQLAPPVLNRQVRFGDQVYPIFVDEKHSRGDSDVDTDEENGKPLKDVVGDEPTKTPQNTQDRGPSIPHNGELPSIAEDGEYLDMRREVNETLQVETVGEDDDLEEEEEPIISEAAEHPDKVRKEEIMRSLHGNSIQENGNLPTIDIKD